MAPSAQAYNRSHSLLLFQKLLNLRNGASPVNLILDSLEQSAVPLVQEFISRAKTSRSKVILVSFATIKKPHNVDVFVKTRAKSLQALRAEILSHCPLPAAPTAKDDASSQKVLIVIDTLNPPASTAPQSLPAFLSSLIVTPATSVVAVYHTDVPLVFSPSFSEYAPHPLTVLCHLATAVFRVSSLHQAVERRRARDRSLQEPEWGLREGREGVLIGLRGGVDVGGGDTSSSDGAAVEAVVVDMEMRRRSGRAVTEVFVLTPAAQPPRQNENQTQHQPTGLGTIALLSDHPAFASPEGGEHAGTDQGSGQGALEEMMTTFDLGLTEKQRRDREGVVLPYFDAQTDIGAGEGGRILYEMGREDDFDDEEDEI